MGVRFTGLAWAVLCLFSSALFAQPLSFEWDSKAFIEGNSAQIYVELLKQYPWISEKYLAAGHKRDPASVIQTAQNHLRKLQEHATYKDAGPRAQPFSFEVHLLREKAQGARGSNAAVVQLFRELQASASNQQIAATEAQLTPILSELSKARLDGIFIGIAHCLPPKEKRQLFVLSSSADRMAYLRAIEPPAPQALASFQFDRFPELARRDWPGVLQWLESKISLEWNLGTRLLGLLWLYENERTPRWDERAMAAFFLKAFDPDSDIVQRLTKALGESKLALKTVKEELTGRGITAQVLDEQTRYEVIETIYVEEASPVLALFRGFVANNCCTEGSASYALLPTSRTFYVRTGSSPKGYVEMIRLKEAGTDNWAHLIHDMDGSFTDAQAQAILCAFQDHKTAIGANAYYFLIDQFRSGHMNSQNAIGTFAKYGSVEKALSLQDAALRAIAGSGLTRLGYDSGDHYGKGNRFVVPEQRPLYRTNAIAIGPELQAQIEARKRAEFVSKLDLAMRDVIDGRALRETDAEVVNAVRILTNESSLPYALYEESWRTLFAEKEIRANAEFRRAREAYFLIGKLRVSDRQAPDVSAKVEEALTTLSRLSPSHSQLDATYADPAFRGFWTARLEEVSGFRGTDPELVKTLYLKTPFLRERILSSPLLLALLAVSKAQQLESDPQIPARLAALPAVFELPPPLLLPLSRLLSNENTEIPEVFSKIAMQMLPRFDLRTFSEAALPTVERNRIAKELTASFRYEEDLEMVRLAGQGLLRSGLIDEPFYQKYHAKFLKDQDRPLEVERLRILDEFYVLAGGTCAARLIEEGNNG